METSLGGRLDATNVIGRPGLTALTPVSIDHVGFLGESLGEIAAEKAAAEKATAKNKKPSRLPQAHRR